MLLIEKHRKLLAFIFVACVFLTMLTGQNQPPEPIIGARGAAGLDTSALTIPVAPTPPPDTPVEKFPPALANSKRLFVANGGGNDPAFQAFMEALKQWGRFQIVTKESEADLFVRFRFSEVVVSENVWVSKNAHTGAVENVKTQNVQGQIALTFYDPTLNTSVASFYQRCKWPGKEKSREKESVAGVQKLVEKLKQRIPAATKS
jgi:hypothetical protein